VEGQNNGKVVGHLPGAGAGLFGAVPLRPDSVIAMIGQRYPVTEIGMVNLIRRIVDVARQEIPYGECESKIFHGAKINDRTCTWLQVVHPVARRHFHFHLARIFVDDQLNLPIRFECYDWPKRPGDEPGLMEEYTYLDVKLNNGFTDEDFSVKNPAYHYRY